MAQPWERQRDEDGNLEPNLWYDRYTAYRLMGASRSVLGCANQERVTKGREESGHAPGSWRNAAKKWDWDTRATAWDEYQRQQDEAKWQARRDEIREADWEQGNELRALAVRILAEGPKFLKHSRKLVKGRPRVVDEKGQVLDPGEPDREIITVALDGRLALQAVKTGSQIQRLSGEMETDRQRIVYQLEREIEAFLDVAGTVLTEDDYIRLLTAIGKGSSEAA